MCDQEHKNKKNELKILFHVFLLISGHFSYRLSSEILYEADYFALGSYQLSFCVDLAKKSSSIAIKCKISESWYFLEDIASHIIGRIIGHAVKNNSYESPKL